MQCDRAEKIVIYPYHFIIPLFIIQIKKNSQPQRQSAVYLLEPITFYLITFTRFSEFTMVVSTNLCSSSQVCMATKQVNMFPHEFVAFISVRRRRKTDVNNWVIVNLYSNRLCYRKKSLILRCLTLLVNTQFRIASPKSRTFISVPLPQFFQIIINLNHVER